MVTSEGTLYRTTGVIEVNAVRSWLCISPDPDYAITYYIFFLLKSDFATHMPMWPFAAFLSQGVHYDHF